MKIGVVGFGFMGRMHFRCWQNVEDAQVAAICEANPAVLEDLTKPTGNVDGAATEIDLSGIRIFDNFDAMLETGELDAISITLPSFLHPDFTEKALNRGVHVLCEKPMALTVEACDRMAAAADASGKTLMIAHCIRFWPEYAKVKEIIDSGEYGAVRAAAFRRVCAAPGWTDDNWFTDKSKSGGMPIDLHIHDTDYVHYVFGLPKSVRSSATRFANGMTGHMVTHYDYGDNKVITAEGSWMMSKSFGFEMSFMIALDKATIVLDAARDPAFRIFPDDGEPFVPELAPGDGYSREIEHFARVAQGDEELSVVTPRQSRDTVRLVLAEEKSAETGGPVIVQ